MSGSTQDNFIKQSRRSAEPTDSPRKRTPTNNRSSAEPEFIMPSIHQNGSVGGSWLGDGKLQETKSRRRRRSPPPGEKLPHRRTKETQSPKPTFQDHVETVFELITSVVRPVLTWIRDIMAIVFANLKTPIAYIILGYVLIGVVVLLRNLAFSSITSALSPICRIPGMSLLGLRMCHYDIPLRYNKTADAPPVEFGDLMNVQDKFDEILREAAGGASLPTDMKRGEASIRDLRQLVTYSTLNTRHELVLEFDGFVETARIATYDLQKFNSHVGRSVDNILATARWTKRVLEGLAERDQGRGAIAGFINNKILAPFQPVAFNEDMLLDQYLQHTRAVEDEVERLVEEAQALLFLLQNLEDRLEVIHGIAIRDDIHVRGSKDEVLGHLWTMLGGNRGKLGKFESQLKLLSQVNAYRQNAIAHVSGTLVKLQGMGLELEELRERVGAVELVGTKGPVSLPLHIENIEMGVERLEKGRRGAREIEHEEQQRSLGKARNGAKMIDER